MMAFLRKHTPKNIIAFYHKTLTVLADFYYGRPSEKMVVIGVTGTNGKSTTVSLIAKILEASGSKVGATSTALFKVAEREWLNDKKMTMLGRFALQKMLRQMVAADCRYAVIETSSQGIEQFRHLGIHYDVCVFTNLTPEHLEAHGGFENYKNAKLKLFKHLEKLPGKVIEGKEISKVIIVNGDDENGVDFLKFNVAEKYVYGLKTNEEKDKYYNIAILKYLNAGNIAYNENGVSFDLDNISFNLRLFGKFNVYNSLAALAVGVSQDVEFAVMKSALEKFTVMPGRMEFIENDSFSAEASQDKKGIKILVDYAPEPESMKQLFETIKAHRLTSGKIIHVLGSCGGGRDTARRPVLGQISAQNSAVAIITNEDPYDDDPALIIDQVASGALSGGLVLGQNLFKIGDRREAIAKALSLARAGDLVLLTGKGSEQAICVAGGKKIPWDEREVVKEELGKT